MTARVHFIPQSHYIAYKVNSAFHRSGI